MDYNEISNSRINDLVAKRLGYEVKKHPDFNENALFEDDKPVICPASSFDPCSNASTAMQIIINHKISLIAPENGIDHWDAVALDKLASHTTNPFRAAMVVFLELTERN